MGTTPQPAQSSTEDSLSALKALAEVGALFLALAFVGGWSYMASYYNAFGLNPFELDFSVPATAAFAVQMMARSALPLILAVSIFLPIAIVGARFKSARRIVASLFIGAFIFTVGAVGSWRGRSLARVDMFETSPRLPNVGFVTKAKMTEPVCLSQGTMDCKLLLHAKGVYYFFEPIIGDDEGPKRNLTVYMVPDSEVSSVRILRGVE